MSSKKGPVDGDLTSAEECVHDERDRDKIPTLGSEYRLGR